MKRKDKIYDQAKRVVKAHSDAYFGRLPHEKLNAAIKSITDESQNTDIAPNEITNVAMSYQVNFQKQLEKENPGVKYVIDSMIHFSGERS